MGLFDWAIDPTRKSPILEVIKNPPTFQDALDATEPDQNLGPFRNMLRRIGHYGWQSLDAFIPNPIDQYKKTRQSYIDFYNWGTTPQKDLDAQEAAKQVVKDGETATVKGSPNVDKIDSDNEIYIGKTFIPDKPPQVSPIEFPPLELAPMPEDRPIQQAVDYTPYLERLEALRPQDMEDRRTYMKNHIWGNVAKALAAGAYGSGWSGGAGVIARAGGAFGDLTAETGRKWYDEYNRYKEQQRQWDMNKINLEMRLAQEANNMAFQGAQTAWQSGEDKRQTTIANNSAQYQRAAQIAQQTHEAAEKNADRFYDHMNTVGQLTQSRVLANAGKGILAIQHTGPDGETYITYKNLAQAPGTSMLDNDTLNAVQDIGAIHGKESHIYKQLRYQQVIAAGDEFDYKRLMAEDLAESGKLEEILGPDAANEVIDAAQKDAQTRGVSAADPDYDTIYGNALSARIAPLLDLKNDELLNRLAAEANSLGAQKILESRAGTGAQ